MACPRACRSGVQRTNPATDGLKPHGSFRQTHELSCFVAQSPRLAIFGNSVWPQTRRPKRFDSESLVTICPTSINRGAVKCLERFAKIL